MPQDLMGPAAPLQDSIQPLMACQIQPFYAQPWTQPEPHHIANIEGWPARPYAPYNHLSTQHQEPSIGQGFNPIMVAEVTQTMTPRGFLESYQHMGGFQPSLPHSAPKCEHRTLSGSAGPRAPSKTQITEMSSTEARPSDMFLMDDPSRW